MRWCKREHVESNALNNCKLKIFEPINSLNLHLLPTKPKLSFRYLKQGIQEFHRKYVFSVLFSWFQLIKLLIMLLLCDDFIISIL